MNRIANCILMLQLLKSKGFLTRDQIAKQLKTNKRNIAEYRKELEKAGYVIKSTTGKFGGYQLVNECMLPATAFRSEEEVALRQMIQYLASHPDFLMAKEANNALCKVLSMSETQEEISDTYIENEQYIISPQMRSMIQLMQQAKQTLQVVTITYRTLKDKEAKPLQIQPYEIINYKGAYYCFAYSLKAKGFRNFKFSEERLKALTVMDTHFVRETDFDLKNHIGKTGLIKGEIYHVEVLIFDESARAIAEKRIGIRPEITWVDERTILLKTMFEGIFEAKKFILSLGRHAKLLSPSNLKEEIYEDVKKMCKTYEDDEIGA